MSFAINARTWAILSGRAIIWLARLFQTRRETNVREDDRFACFESIETATNCFCSNTRLRLQLLPTRNKIKICSGNRAPQILNKGMPIA